MRKGRTMVRAGNQLQNKVSVWGLCELGMREGSTMERVGEDQWEKKTTNLLTDSTIPKNGRDLWSLTKKGDGLRSVWGWEREAQWRQQERSMRGEDQPRLILDFREKTNKAMFFE